MIKVIEIVNHDGKEYVSGDIIEKIEKKQAQRLVDLGVAFFVDESDSDNPGEKLDGYTAEKLKKAAKEVGLEFAGNIGKAKLIEQIINEDKEDEVLAAVEADE